MEYIEGDTLEHYINNISGPIPQEIAIPMMLDVLSALDFRKCSYNKFLH